MKLHEWWPLYSGITQDFSFDPGRDYLSSLVLSSILGKDADPTFLGKLRGRKVTVVGNAPELPNIVESLPDAVTVVADSALGTYSDARGCPDFVVTDLDGPLEALWKCMPESSAIIHAHGDNIPEVRNLRLNHGWKVMGTTQNIPLWNIFNCGGFTDGDRAAFIADEAGASGITLAGFDFARPNPVKGGDLEAKGKKLQWAKKLLEGLAASRGTSLTPGDIIDI